MPGYSAVGQAASARRYDPSFPLALRWAPAALLSLGLLVAQTMVAVAHGASIDFKGYVPARGAASVYIGKDQLVAFGATAGIRLHAVNSTRMESRLSYVVFDDASNTVAGGMDLVRLVPPGERIATIVAFPLGNGGTQRFRLCAKHEHMSAKPSPYKCFPLVVTRLD